MITDSDMKIFNKLINRYMEKWFCVQPKIPMTDEGVELIKSEVKRYIYEKSQYIYYDIDSIEILACNPIEINIVLKKVHI